MRFYFRRDHLAPYSPFLGLELLYNGIALLPSRSFPWLSLICLFKELFGSESSSQVYAQITEWMSTLREENLRKIKWLLYDDMCHLGMSYSFYHLPFIEIFRSIFPEKRECTNSYREVLCFKATGCRFLAFPQSQSKLAFGQHKFECLTNLGQQVSGNIQPICQGADACKFCHL